MRGWETGDWRMNEDTRDAQTSRGWDEDEDENGECSEQNQNDDDSRDKTYHKSDVMSIRERK